MRWPPPIRAATSRPRSTSDKKRPGSLRAFWSLLVLPAATAAAATTATAATAAIAATTTTAAAAAVTAAAAAGARLILGFVDAQRSAAQFLAVQVLDCPSCIGLAHLDKSKATRPPGFPIGRQRH